MKHIVLGIVAHVDAGKTTLSENLLFKGGSIRKMGRVDTKDAFLDNFAMERDRGITIFSKQAMIRTEQLNITLLDTPGHVDFSAEMERTLQVLDYAILVISAADGVTGHTKTLWQLLTRYNVPVFIFVNKMDMRGMDKDAILKELKDRLSNSIVDFEAEKDEFYEEVATANEELMNRFLEGEEITEEDVAEAVAMRQIFPCYFGSALKSFGVDTLMEGIARYSLEKEYDPEFSAIVYKISRDKEGKRLTHMKITGGSLKNRYEFPEYGKVSQIRIYSGERFETRDEVQAGMICAVTGLTGTVCGMQLGVAGEGMLPVLEPVLTYRIILLKGTDVITMLPKLKELEEEEPALHIAYNEENGEIQAELMGEVQTEIIKKIIEERYGVVIEFGTGKIVYKETIAGESYGIGHFEPLRHYAEVHLRLEPLERGCGLVYETDCSEDILARNWQRLIHTHLEERAHKGVLTGSKITDMKITLVTGKAHTKHTEGGDFRQATYRAVRNGLMYAESVLLEPYYSYVLEIPEGNLGRAMTDIERLHGTMNPPEIQDGMAVLTGHAPVVLIQDYQKEVTAYTKGYGKITLNFYGYEKCHNTEEVVERIGYIPENDIRHTPDSVFCAGGSGYVLPWNEIREKAHMPILDGTAPKDSRIGVITGRENRDIVLGTEEIDAIIMRAGGANSSNRGNRWKKSKSESAPVVRNYKPAKIKDKYLLVDGYNIIHAWESLKELAKSNLDGARGRLLDILCDYQAIRKIELIVVFDAYKVKGHDTEYTDYHNIHVVYTKEAETADRYIEKFAHENAGNYDIMVATSDGLEQIIIRGAGCSLISAMEFETEVMELKKSYMDNYRANSENEHNYEIGRQLDLINNENMLK